MTANFPVTVEKQRDIPAKTGFEHRVYIDVDLSQADAPGRKQCIERGRHFIAKRAACPAIERQRAFSHSRA